MQSPEEYLNRLKNVKTQIEAQRVLRDIYSQDSSSGENTYKVNVGIKEEDKLAGWDIFYQMVEIEKKFFPVTSIFEDKKGNTYENRDHSASAYLATFLTMPKTRQNFLKKSNVRTKTCPEYSDHLNDVFIHISSSVIPKWQQEKNDNFFAFLRAELLTVVNETAALDIPEYWTDSSKNGEIAYSNTSLDKYMEGDGDQQRDVADNETLVEDKVLRKIEIEEANSLRALMIRNPHDLFSKENIEAAIISTKLFGGLGSIANEMLQELDKVAMEH